MLIRTQNKKGLVNLNNIDFITTGGEKSIITFCGNSATKFGNVLNQRKSNQSVG